MPPKPETTAANAGQQNQDPDPAGKDAAAVAAATAAADATKAAREKKLEAPAEKDWTEAWVIADGDIPAAAAGHGVVVVESRDDDGLRSKTSYPAGADTYVAYPGSVHKVAEGDDGPTMEPDAPVDFGVDPSAQVLTLGDNLTQGGFEGFSTTPSVVHIGPASPAWVGANVAFLRGARKIHITGLTESQQANLQRYATKLIADPDAPKDLSITFD